MWNFRIRWKLIATGVWSTICHKDLNANVMYTTLELWQACLCDPVLPPLIRGVFPSEKLPVINTYPATLIANTDPHNKPGTHWAAMYF